MSGEHGTGRHPGHIAFEVAKAGAFAALPWLGMGLVIAAIWACAAVQFARVRASRDVLAREIREHRAYVAERDRRWAAERRAMLGGIRENRAILDEICRMVGDGAGHEATDEAPDGGG